MRDFHGTMGMTFDEWFAWYLHQDQRQVEQLLCDKTAIRFLIAWSLFESRCFRGFMRTDKLSVFANDITHNQAFRKDDLQDSARYFHNRYQDRRRYKNLIHRESSEGFEHILSTKFDKLSDYQLIFMLLFVVYRFRNNIFHGNKGVQSWLRYKEQIGLCTGVMQLLISLKAATESVQTE